MPSLWRPLRRPVFRNLLAANVVSDVGTFMQSVGAAWLMVSFGAGPLAVALIQTASALPFFLLALPAGAIGDIVDRRRLILATETWMAAAAAALAVLTLAGRMSPWALLAFTFAISAGDAVEAPSWRAALPEMVPPEDLAAASALNGIEFNLARAIGPGAAAALISAAGVGPAFAFNALSFAGVILVVGRWRRPRREVSGPVEHLRGATVAALRYVLHAPAIRGLILRAGIVMVFAGAIFALLPTLAHRASSSPLGYGLLLGCVGAGAIGGALLMQPARARWPTETVVTAAILGLGAVLVGTGAARSLWALAALMLAAGACWIVFVSLLSAAVQLLAPDWIRARALAVYLLVFQGGVAAGSALWGAIGQRAGLGWALAGAGAGTLATAALGRLWRLPDGHVDLAPWNHWPAPAATAAHPPALDAGPVLVTVEYAVGPADGAAFRTAMQDYQRLRRRDGATRWGIYQDSAAPDRYLETFLVRSWAEHLRQHARLTQADRALETRIQSLIHGAPTVRHLLYARPGEEPLAALRSEQEATAAAAGSTTTPDG
jgi:MFS family permease